MALYGRAVGIDSEYPRERAEELARLDFYLESLRFGWVGEPRIEHEPEQVAWYYDTHDAELSAENAGIAALQWETAAWQED